MIRPILRMVSCHHSFVHFGNISLNLTIGFWSLLYNEWTLKEVKRTVILLQTVGLSMHLCIEECSIAVINSVEACRTWRLITGASVIRVKQVLVCELGKMVLVH
jgi:hypothetical protein